MKTCINIIIGDTLNRDGSNLIECISNVIPPQIGSEITIKKIGKRSIVKNVIYDYSHADETNEYCTFVFVFI